MAEEEKNGSGAKVAAVLVGAVALGLVAVFAVGGLFSRSAPPPKAVEAKGPAAAEEPEPKLRRRANWAYYRGDLKAEMERLADFDLVVAPLAASDVASVRWLESRGCRVVAEEPKFGGLLKDGRGEKTVARIDGAVCWIGADFSHPDNKILQQENRKTIDALREYALEHPGEKVLVFAAGLPKEGWLQFRVLMARFGFVPSAGPADASSIYDYVHESAAAVPRPNREG